MKARGAFDRIDFYRSGSYEQSPSPRSDSTSRIRELLLCSVSSSRATLVTYRCEITELEPEKHRVEIDMTLTAPGCGMGPILRADVERRVMSVPGVESANIEVVFEPMWTVEMMSEAARLELGM